MTKTIEIKKTEIKTSKNNKKITCINTCVSALSTEQREAIRQGKKKVNSMLLQLESGTESEDDNSKVMTAMVEKHTRKSIVVPAKRKREDDNDDPCMSLKRMAIINDNDNGSSKIVAKVPIAQKSKRKPLSADQKQWKRDRRALVKAKLGARQVEANRDRNRRQEAIRRLNQASEKKAKTAKDQRLRMKNKRLNATEHETNQERQQNRARMQEMRSNLTEHEAAVRREQSRIQMQILRSQETEAEARRENEALQRATSRRNGYEIFFRAAYEYSPLSNYTESKHVNIGKMDKQCAHCKALTWKNEAKGICCGDGKVKVKLIPEPISPLSEFLYGKTPIAKYFRENIRRFNSAFQMTSFGVAWEDRYSGFMPTFRIQGQVYHKIGSLLPSTGQSPTFLQIYFVDNTAQKEIRSNFSFLEQKQKLFNREIVSLLQDMLCQHNALVREFKNKLHELDVPEKVLRIKADYQPIDGHRGQFNQPTASEMAVIMVGDQTERRDIVLTKHGGGLQSISELHQFYDGLQYPLLLWNGQEGYSINIPQQRSNTTKTVSARAFYAYQLMTRDELKGNPLLHFREVFHQYIVDMYAKIESERLNYIRFHQVKLRAEQYVHLRDAMANENANPNDIGTKVILPATFTGSPRHMQQYAQDALACVRKYGRPDLFITFTCNPKWPEITELLYDGQKSTHRHDIIARVFYQKLKVMINVLTNGQVFGRTRGYMYSVEWQKRGLPHAHILLWLQDKIRPEEIDQIICAEIPRKRDDPKLYSSVTSHMIHGPCGNICLKDGKCSKRFPKPFVLETSTDRDGYPLYRRRSPAEGGQVFVLPSRKRGEPDTIIDNSFVVPYSPLLLAIFDSHINIEYCNSVKAIKYLCKYVYKGSDQAAFQVSTTDTNATTNANINANDEVTSFQIGRYISSNEAIWRILDFPIHGRDPAVIALDVHLENGERIYFNEDNIQHALENGRQTTLKAFFELCARDEFARTLLYCEVPNYYTWNNKKWQRRKRGEPVPNWPQVFKSKAVGRVYSVHPSQQECFYLRILLHYIRGPRSFDELKTVDGVVLTSFKSACLKLKLLEDDEHLFQTMEEGVEVDSPTKLRDLFATILSTYYPANASELWEKFKFHLTEDILHRFRIELGNSQLQMTHEMENEALIIIEDKIVAMCGRTLNDFDIESPSRDSNDACIEIIRETSYDMEDLSHYVAQRLPLIGNVPEQQAAYNLFMEKINSNEGSLTFLDAPGGTGKTFLLNVILAEVRSKGDIALATATSGIAATLLDGGRTAHSTFKLPLKFVGDGPHLSSIGKNSGVAQLLRECKLIVWDECTMANKKAFECLDATLRDFRNCDQIMGGVTVIIAGDFRQTLPIINRGTPADEIAACLKYSRLWSKVQSHKLSVNMRAFLTGDSEAGTFAEDLQELGNGDLPADSKGYVQLRENFCNYVEDLETLQSKLYSNIKQKCKPDESYYTWLCERAILAPTNDNVNKINSEILKTLSDDQPKSYKSFDTTREKDDAARYPTEFLNSQELSGMPQHDLQLKIGAPIILLRNLNAPKLCNGTRLCIKALKHNLIEATILTGCDKGKEVLIPRIPILAEDIPFPFKRVQFPVRLAFAMTINKSQGQSLRYAGVSLEQPCFSHGQLYVACSRVGTGKNLYIHAPSRKTKNVVYKQVLN